MSEHTTKTASPFSIGRIIKTILIGSRFAAPAAVYGCGTVAAMWVVCFFTLLPGASIPPMVTGIALLLCMAIGAGLAGRHFGKTLGWRVAIASGWTTVKLNVFVLGALLAKTPEHVTAGKTVPEQGMSGLHLSALGPIAGFTLLSVVISVIAGFIGSRGTKDRSVEDLDLSSNTWLPRFALLTSIVFLPLILIGGMVTTTGSGMSVKGWPTSDGANMFLYPISLMTSHESIFLEHSHRLFGTLAGLLTIALTIWTTLSSRSPVTRISSWILLGLVIIQGVLGGFRVIEASATLAMLHGIMGQITFGLAAGLTTTLFLINRPTPVGEVQADEKRLKGMSSGLVHTLLLQLALGAAFRHLRIENAGAMHALWAHVALSLVAFGMSVVVGAFARAVGRDHNDAPLRRFGTGIIICVVVQALIGIMSLIFVLGGQSREQVILQPNQLETQQVAIPAYEILTRTLHQANGALLLASAAAVNVIARFRIRRENTVIPPIAWNATA